MDKQRIRNVFRDVQRHQAIAQLIRRYSTNKEDIRKTALKDVDLSRCRKVLELGCAFGAFTEALKNKLHPEARITGIDIIQEYKPFFLEACQRTGYKCRFSPAGIDKIKKYETSSSDLVICSYALYFFVDMIPEIARVLTKDGIFITITHSRNSMKEIIDIVKIILQQSTSADDSGPLPIETLFEQFSAENGERLLKPYFSSVQTIDFNNSLIFRNGEVDHFMDYFYFKKSFFLTGANSRSKTITDKLLQELQETVMKNDFVSMRKDDRIFICSKPKELPKGSPLESKEPT